MKKFIEEIAREAGSLAVAGRASLDESAVRTKASESDLVTEVDKAVERLIREAVSKRWPDHGFLGEEGGEEGQGSEFRWVVDPIDGTTNFVHEHPFHCVSVALQRNGESVAAAVYAPRLDEMFTAFKGEGSFLNGQRIKASGRLRLKDSLVSVGLACLRAKMERNNLPNLVRVAPKCRDVRRCGSAALDLCYVGAGRYDAYWEMALNLYDVAAGQLVASEAGAVVTDMRGGSMLPEAGIVAANRFVHAELLALLDQP